MCMTVRLKYLYIPLYLPNHTHTTHYTFIRVPIQTTTHAHLIYISTHSGLAQCTCVEVRQGSNFVVTGQDSCENLKVR